jgi:hypothetical protein
MEDPHLMRTRLSILIVVPTILLALALRTPAQQAQRLSLSAQAYLPFVGRGARPVTGGFLTSSGARFQIDGQPFVIKGFNYYPRNYAWSSMEEWHWSEVEQELAQGSSLGANTVRAFIDYGFSTGNPWQEEDIATHNHPTAGYLEALERLLGIADRYGLKTIFTLLDWMPGWAFIDQRQHHIAEAYLTELISGFVSDPRIAAWDILNEGDLLPETYGSQWADVLAFYQAVSAHIRSLDANHLITAGFGRVGQAHRCEDLVDFVSFHHYADQARLGEEIRQLRSRLSHPMPIVLGEFGHPSGGIEGSSLSAHILALGTGLDTALEHQGLAGALFWMLTDTNPPLTDLTRGGEPGVSQELLKQYGVLEGNLQPKPSAIVVTRFFSGEYATPTQIKLSFSKGLTEPLTGDSRYLAIGVHRLDFLDGSGATLGSMDFGTIEANQQQGHGWYSNEAWGQWAGSLERFAVLYIVMPEGARSIRLSAHAYLADTQLQVSYGGMVLGTANLGTVPAEHTFPLPRYCQRPSCPAPLPR